MPATLSPVCDGFLKCVEGWIDPPRGLSHSAAVAHVRTALLSSLERRTDDPSLCESRVGRALFADIRFCFPLSRQADVWRVVVMAGRVTSQLLDDEARAALRRCPTFTRRGLPCQREPLANGYCPSHQHLVEQPFARR